MTVYDKLSLLLKDKECRLSARELHKFLERESNDTLVFPQTIEDIVDGQAFHLSYVEDVYSILIHISIDVNVDKSIKKYDLDTRFKITNVLMFIQSKTSK